MTQEDIPLSVTIIVRNEEHNLSACLASLPKHCEIIVVDSGSTDKTVDLAKTSGAFVHHHPFSNYAEQKNFALAQASQPWILSLDADERLSPDLVKRIVALITDKETPDSLYAIRRQLFFMGRAMRFGRTIDYPVRLFKRGSAHFSGTIHESLKPISTSIKTQTICSGAIYHHSYRDLSDYFTKFNRYTTAMADERLRRGVTTVCTLSLCMRPPLVFFYRYTLKLGFLDGYPGFVWAFLASFYSFVKYAKLKEVLASKKDSARAS